MKEQILKVIDQQLERIETGESTQGFTLGPLRRWELELVRDFIEGFHVTDASDRRLLNTIVERGNELSKQITADETVLQYLGNVDARDQVIEHKNYLWKELSWIIETLERAGETVSDHIVCPE